MPPSSGPSPSNLTRYNLYQFDGAEPSLRPRQRPCRRDRPSMTTFIVRRLLISIPVFLGITILVFTFIALAPGSLADALIRPELGTNPEARATIIARYGLDQPIPIRYVLWLANALQGDLGYRAMNGTPVAAEVWRGLTASHHPDRHRVGHRTRRRRPARDPVGGPPVLEARLPADRDHLPGDLAAVVPAGDRRPLRCSGSNSSSSRSPG